MTKTLKTRPILIVVLIIICGVIVYMGWRAGKEDARAKVQIEKPMVVE